MKLFTFASKLTLKHHVGVMVPGKHDEVCDLTEALSTTMSLKDLIGMENMKDIVQEGISSGKGRKLVASLDIVAPIGDPDKILCVGMNYREHCIEQDVPIPEEPTMFSKFNNTITKYNGDVIFDSKLTQEMDWEVEMVIVIGKEGKINGKVICKNADFEGVFSGNLEVKETLTLKSSSKTEGDVIISKLIVDAGAFFNAKCSMKLTSDVKSISDNREKIA